MGRKFTFRLAPQAKLRGGDGVVAGLDQLQLRAKRVASHHTPIEISIAGMVTVRKHSVISHDHGTNVGIVTQATSPGQTRIDHVLQDGAYDFHGLCTRSQLTGVPASMSRAARLPMMSFRWRVCKPWAGRMERTLRAVNSSPCLTGSTTKRERRKT